MWQSLARLHKLHTKGLLALEVQSCATSLASGSPPSVSVFYPRYFGGASLLAKHISLFTDRLPVFDFQADKHRAQQQR